MGWFKDVLEFMQIGQTDKIASSPTMPPKDIRKLCHNLIQEEVVGELLPAINNNENIVDIADAIVDGIYVHLFAAHCYGLPIEDIWNAVHAANMRKFPEGRVLRDPANGKVLKPDNWIPPTTDITAAIVRRIEEVKLFCPSCGKRHHDTGVWRQRPHRTHLCIDDKFGPGCGAAFRVQRSPLLFGTGL